MYTYVHDVQISDEPCSDERHRRRDGSKISRMSSRVFVSMAFFLSFAPCLVIEIRVGSFAMYVLAVACSEFTFSVFRRCTCVGYATWLVCVKFAL